MLRGKVLNKNECHSGIGGKMLQEPFECFKTAGGGADRNDREGVWRGQIVL